MATVLVTGGAGYIGSHACKALARAGHVPVTYDNLSRGHRELVKWGPLEVGDVLDRAALMKAFAAHKPRAVMHFASYIFVNESVAQPEMYHRNIVDGMRALLDAMDACGITRIVVSSSCAVYGLPDKMPIDESAPCRPINPYGSAKLAMEGLLAEGQKNFGLSWTAMRYFNAAGADPDGETGEWHDPEPHLIPQVLDAALGANDGLVINGTDYDTPDGTCIRDYVHVADLADAHVLALSRDLPPGSGEIFNLGSGGGYSVREVIDTARTITGREIPAREGSRRAGDPAMLVADTALATRTLGWTARRPLSDQIADAWAWHRRLKA